jgi:hypothetical protein
MALAAVLRAEAARLRALSVTIPDREVLVEIRRLINELESRARRLNNGDASDPVHQLPDARHVGMFPSVGRAAAVTGRRGGRIFTLG